LNVLANYEHESKQVAAFNIKQAIIWPQNCAHNEHRAGALSSNEQIASFEEQTAIFLESSRATSLQSHLEKPMPIKSFETKHKRNSIKPVKSV